MQFTPETVKHSAIDIFKTKNVEIMPDNEVVIKGSTDVLDYCITVYEDWHVRFFYQVGQDKGGYNYKVYSSFDLIKLLEAIKTRYIDHDNVRWAAYNLATAIVD